MTTTLIVGAGHAGSQCAISLRAEGYQGQIVLVNNDEGMPYHKPPLSKKYLRSDNPEATPLRAASAYEKAQIEWVQQSVQSIDVASGVVSFGDGSQHVFDYLVLATGARNREHPELASCSNALTLRSIHDANNIHALVTSGNEFAVLGGGFIGLELAACLSELGKKVTVLEAADRLLGRVVAPEISEKIFAGLMLMGIDVLTHCQDTIFNLTDFRVTGATTNAAGGQNNEKPQTITCDAMLVGIGAIPNTDLAAEAGIQCDNGVVVNASLETSAANVYAIGDCAQFPHWQTNSNLRLESVQNAVDQAKCVAKTIATNTPTEFKTVPWFWSDIGKMKLQIAGLPGENTHRVLRESDGAIALYHLHESKVVCVESINSAKDHMLARKLIDKGTEVTPSQIQQGTDTLKSLL